MQNSTMPEGQRRPKEPTEMELRNLKVVIQKLSLSPHHEVYYNLATKESKSGFFNNDRLIILNTKDRYLGYVSKLPEGLIPLLNENEVKSLKFKVLVRREEINNGVVKDFRCYQMPGKLSTFQVFYKRGNRGEIQQWNMTLGNPTIMKQWVQLINNTILKDEPEPEPIPAPAYQPPPVLQSQNVVNQQIVPAIEVSKPPPPRYQPEPPEPQPQPELVPPRNINNSVVHVSNISNDQYQPIQSSRIANMPYYDHITELQYLRKQKPELFQLSNDLSRKKLENYQPDNNNTLNVYGYKPTSSNLIQERQRKSQGSRSKIERGSGVGSSVHEDVFGREGSNRPRMSTQIVKQSLSNSKLGITTPIDYNPPLESQNLQYKPYNTVNIDHESNVKASSSHEYQKAKEYQQAFENPITNSRNQLDPFSKDSRKSVTIDYQKYNGGDIEYNRMPGPSNSEVRMNDQRASQIKNQGLAKSYLSKQSRAESKKGFNSRGMARKKWNEIFAQTNNKLDIYEDFIHTCFNTAREIINELPLDSNRRQYLPIQARPPFLTYYNQGIIFTLHHFTDSKNISNSNVKHSPLLFDHSTYELLKRQFYNYNLVLAVTANEGFIKVPLCAYFQYKGILVLCKAQIPQSFEEVTPKRYEKQFQIIENQLHIRFAFGSFNSYLHQNQKYIILDNMKEFIPEYCISKEATFFRKEFLIGCQMMIEDQDGCLEAHQILMEKNLSDLLGKLQSLQTYIVNSYDLSRSFHEEGLSLSYLPSAIQQTRSPFLKRLFLTQLVSSIFTSIFRSQLNNIYSSFSQAQQYKGLSLDETQQMMVDSAHTLIDMLFGYSNNAQNLWKIIEDQSKLRYKMVISKQDLIAGYLLGSVIEKMGVQCNFRSSSFDKHNVDFFGRNQNLPRDLFEGFRMKIRRFDLESISAQVDSVQQILSSEPTPDNFQALVNTLNLKTQSIPNYLYSLQEPLLAYLCNFVPYSQHEQFQHIGIYNMVLLEPHSYNSTKCSLLALKWCVKKKLNEEAIRIFEMKELENVFWQGEYNPAISQFYDFFAMYNASVGQYQQAIQLAKLSLKNTMQVAGINELPVADKHYQLGNIFFKMGRKEDALREYSKTKEILMMHSQTNISQFAVIMLKLAVLFLNFGKIPQAVAHSLQALKIFDSSQGTENDQIGTFQVLARCYEITKKQEELENICDLAAEKFNATEDCLIFQRMLKLMLYTKLKQLSSPQSKSFLFIISKLQEQVSDYSEMESFSFLNRKCQESLLVRKVERFLENIVFLNEQATKKDLFRRYKSLQVNTRSEAEQMLVVFESIGLLIGFGFMIGSLRQVYE